MRAPFRIRVYNKSFGFLFALGDPETCSVTLRHLGKGTGSITIPINHRRASALMSPGVRVVIEYLVNRSGDYGADSSWLQVISGPLWTKQGNGGSLSGSLTFQIEDDYRVLEQVLAWPSPAEAVNSQSVVADNRSGKAETVIKAYFGANAITRLGLPITLGTDQARGANVSASLRFDSLMDALPPLAATGGLGITIKQKPDDSGLLMDVYAPTDRSSRPLSERSGTLADWQFSSSGPAATRVIVGGGGEGILRGFTRTIDSTRETEWGIKSEAFVDASGATTADDLTQAATEALQTTQASAGFSVTATENNVVRYGVNLFVGDKVAVEIREGLTVVDTLKAVTLSWTDNNGLVVLPQVGDTTSSESPNAVLARAISRAFAGIRRLRSQR